jgi:myo-inositol-1-phosphate synthase
MLEGATVVSDCVVRSWRKMASSRAEPQTAKGKLGVLLVGLGAVSTTFIAGVEAVRRGLGLPIGSLSQMGLIRRGSQIEGTVSVKDLVQLADLQDLVFGAWDISDADAFHAAVNADVLEKGLLESLKPFLSGLRPMKGIFDPHYVKRLSGSYVKSGGNKFDLAEQLIAEIEEFRERNECDRLVMIWCASTEIFMQAGPAHESVAAFEQAMRLDSGEIAPSMIYAYAALRSGIPFANGAPNLTVDFAALVDLAHARNVPFCGKDFKTGQTLLKSILAPGFKARLLGMRGWYSTNLLGNRDGEVLSDPDSFTTKEHSKLSALEHILEPDLYRELYQDMKHLVRIDYYPPRGDNKEAWDSIDIFGWLGYPMQMKINFLCRDSILAAPLVLDLALFLDLAQRAGGKGNQAWLDFYFKSPMMVPGHNTAHDLFTQLTTLENTLRRLGGGGSITDHDPEFEG